MRGNLAVHYLLSLTFFMVFTFSSGYGLKKEFNFMGIKLGMTGKEISNSIAKSDSLKIDDSRYLGKINEAIPYTLKIDSHPYIQNIYIQFYQGKSFLIIILLNEKYFDFYNLTEKLEDKYGIPILKTSKTVKWENGTDNVRLVLEKPSTVKVFDMVIMKKLQTEISQKNYIMTNNSILQYEKNLILDEL